MNKKLFAIALSLILILSMSSFAALADETEGTPSLDFFDGFDTEASLENWTPGGNNGNRPITSIDTAVTDAPPGEDFGTGTLKFDVFASADNGLGLNRTVQNPEPGATYVFSAWIKNAEGGTAAIGIGGYSTASFSNWKAGDSTTTVNAWVRLICSYTVPTDGSVTELTMVIRHDWDAATWVDNVYFYKYTGTNPLALNDTYLHNNGFERVSAGTVKTSADDATLVETLRPNGWTVLSELNFSASGTNYAVVSDETAHSGKYSLKIKTESNTANKRVYRTITGLEAGASYVVTAYVKTIGTPSGDGTFMYVTGSYSGGGTSHWTQSTFEKVKTQTAASAQSGEWVPIRTFFTAPAALTNGTGYIVLTGYDDTKTFVAYYDDITVTKMDVPSTFILDSTGNTLKKNADKTTLAEATIVFSAANTSDSATVDYQFMYVLYDESGTAKQITSLNLVNKTVPVSTKSNNYVQPGFLRESIPVTIPVGHSMKVFVFDDISSLSPLAFASVE